MYFSDVLVIALFCVMLFNSLLISSCMILRSPTFDGKSNTESITVSNSLKANITSIQKHVWAFHLMYMAL